MVSEDVAQRVTSYIQHQAQKPHDELLALVEENQRRLVALVENISDERSRVAPPGEGEQWCLRELLLHVVAAERGVANIVRHASRGEQPETRGGPASQDADAGQPFADIVATLRSVNADMLDAIRTLPAEPQTDIKPKHPFFGPLNCLEWAVFQRVHDADHIQHAQRILA